MSRVNHVSCPHCGTAMKSGRGVRVGRTIPCPRCGAFFTVPAGVGASGEWDGGRLLFAVFLMLLYLGGGAALACYCWTLNTQKTTAAPAAVAQTPDDAGKEPPAPARPVQKPTVPLDPADDLQVDNAIIKGVWYLKNNQHDDGSWGANLPAGQFVPVGYTALPALALLECGVPADDHVIAKAAAFVRAHALTLAAPSPYITYQLALAILFLDRLGDAKDKELIQLLALPLIAAASAPTTGAGDTCAPNLDRKDLYGLLMGLRDEHVSLDRWRGEALKGQEFDAGRSDNSNTQFAVLALWVAAQRYGVPIGRSIDLVEQRFRTTQLADGAWPYNPETGTGSSPWPTMTASGLLGLAVAHGTTTDAAKQKQNPLDDKNIRDGLNLLAGGIDRPDEDRTTDLYFLWSVERVGVIYNLRTIGKDKKDWYAWGRRLLLASQESDGHWQEGAYYDNNAIHNTCFALLFLKQANLAQELSDKFALLEKEKK